MVVECSHQWLLLLLDAVQGCFVGVEIHAQLPPKTSPKVAQFTVSADCNAISTSINLQQQSTKPIHNS